MHVCCAGLEVRLHLAVVRRESRRGRGLINAVLAGLPAALLCARCRCLPFLFLVHQYMVPAASDSCQHAELTCACICCALSYTHSIFHRHTHYHYARIASNVCVDGRIARLLVGAVSTGATGAHVHGWMVSVSASMHATEAAPVAGPLCTLAFVGVTQRPLLWLFGDRFQLGEYANMLRSKALRGAI